MHSAARVKRLLAGVSALALAATPAAAQQPNLAAAQAATAQALSARSLSVSQFTAAVQQLNANIYQQFGGDLTGAFPNPTIAPNAVTANKLAAGAAVANGAASSTDTRFPATVTGLRKSAGAGSTDTAAVPGNAAGAGDYVSPTGAADSTTVTVPNGVARSQQSIATDVVNLRDLGALGDAASDIAAYNKAETIACANATAGRGTHIVFPGGSFTFSQTMVEACNYVTISGEQRNSAFINRTTDYGPTIEFANPSGYISNVGASDLVVYGSGMTTSGSVAHFVFDGVVNGSLQNVHASEGVALASLTGVQRFVGSKLVFLSTVGAGTGRDALLVGPSTNTNLSTPMSSDIHFDDYEVKAFDGTNFHVSTGVHLTAVDGFWLTNSHIEGATLADMQVTMAASGTYIGNINVDGTMFDQGQGHGLLFDGAGIVTRANIKAAFSGNGAGTSAAAAKGIRITGAGGVIDARLAGTVDGYLGDALYSDATYINNVETDLVAANNGGGITFTAGNDVTIKGQVGGGSVRTESYGVNIGSGYAWAVDEVVRNTSGVGVATGSGTYHAKLGGVFTGNTYAAALQGNFVVFTGNDASGNNSGVLQSGLTCNFCLTTGNLGQ